MRRTAVAAAAALLAVLTAGCGGHGGTAERTPATFSGYSEMQQKVDAAESALTQADRDAARDDTGR
ncbi:hypothetical protein [Streptomyces sp. NPDC059378]|uniref:hypothetical protein n=1 Tax=Streptomyces sp. NPDC059378 TaxID=3346815 RepID=UPI0036B11D8A